MPGCCWFTGRVVIWLLVSPFLDHRTEALNGWRSCLRVSIFTFFLLFSFLSKIFHRLSFCSQLLSSILSPKNILPFMHAHLLSTFHSTMHNLSKIVSLHPSSSIFHFMFTSFAFKFGLVSNTFIFNSQFKKYFCLWGVILKLRIL